MTSPFQGPSPHPRAALTGSDVLAPGETLHVLLSEPGLAEKVDALSPRTRAHLVEVAQLPGDAAGLVQVWVPQGRSRVPGPDFFRALPRLRLVQLPSAGAENFAGLVPAGVTLARASGAFTPATAEWAVAVTLAAQRGIPDLVRQQDAGVWRPAVHRSLIGARVLVVGAGEIGRAIGGMLAPFGVELAHVARTRRPEVHGPEDLPSLLPWADIVILIVPATPSTTGMVDAAFLGAMADGALLVNAARGVVVDTDALLAELVRGRLRAALDVTDPEPLPEGHPLWSAPNVLLTPHLAGTVPLTRERADAAVLAQLRRVLEGEPLLGIVGEY